VSGNNATVGRATRNGPEPAQGRPRDPRVDEGIRRATLELLSEKGFTETTVAAVARRAGVGAPAIYRRWSSRIAMIEDAIFPGFDQVTVQATGDLRSDLRRYVDEFVATFNRPAARAALPGLLSVYQSDPANYALIGQRVGGGVRPDFRAMLSAAAPGAGVEVDSDDVLDLLIGAVLFHVFIRSLTGRDMASDYIVDLLTRAVTGSGDLPGAATRGRAGRGRAG
jgi:AcrR family transcriptional regulator